MAAGERGFTYIALLMVMATVGIGLAVTGPTIVQSTQHEKEQELLFVGGEYRKVIMRYYESAPGVKRYPRTLEELLDDKRFPTTRRYLRRLYADPMTHDLDWGLVRGYDGGIVGVYSQSAEAPFKTNGFKEEFAEFAGKASYREWVFAYASK